MDNIKVLVVDDHAILRDGLVTLLQTEPGIEVVGEAEDGAIAVRKAIKLRPDVIIMDILMPVMDGIDATREIHSKLPTAKILILTTSTVSDDLAKAIDAGASGAIAKSADFPKLLSAIHDVAAGKLKIAKEIKSMISNDPPAPSLSQRQEEILLSMTRGLTNADIANQLGISPLSVKVHANLLFKKLGAANRAEAVTIALRKHLLKI